VTGAGTALPFPGHLGRRALKRVPVNPRHRLPHTEPLEIGIRYHHFNRLQNDQINFHTTMRIRLEVRRPNWPPVKVLWNTAGLRPGAAGQGSETTTAQLLEQVNEVVQLEVGACGLDDYVVEAQGFECLHFSILDRILEEDAQVT
jgi:hypothetical protein